MGELLGPTHINRKSKEWLCDKINYKNYSVSSSHERAVLESVSINLEAGIAMVDKQETALAKIEGKLSEIALALNQVKSPKSCEKVRTSSSVKLEETRDRIREIAQETFDHVALFSNGPSNQEYVFQLQCMGRYKY